MQFLNALTPFQWAVAAAVPIGVIALYFLKLRRKPVRVPSTYLWQKSVEDLHVNSLFQRLRRNLLLFLQLLILALALVALARPAWLGSESGGMWHVILIDNSASMSAIDVEPTRLEWAKQQAREQVIDGMASDDQAMIISFNDAAQVVCSYTTNRQVLRQQLASIEPTQRTTNLREALDLAAGLANPESFAAGARDTEARVEEEAVPQLHLFTDGGFAEVKNFSLGRLQPHFYPAGAADANVGVLAMSVRRNDDRPDRLRVFARLFNFSAQPLGGRAELHLDGALKDAADVQLQPKAEHAVGFDLENLEQGVLELRLDIDDLLKDDNVARCVVGNVRRAKVLAVSRGNRYLELALGTEASRSVADVEFMAPDELSKDDYKGKAESGHYDLIVYDACAPETMPQANTLFLGAIPKLPALGEVKTLVEPIVADVDESSPLFRFIGIDMTKVIILESQLPQLPPGTQTLLDSGDGPLAFLLTREGFWDCVIGFGFTRETAEGPKPNTSWPFRPSFPMFVQNALRVLGNVQDAISDETLLPGQTVALRSESLDKTMTVKDPKGERHAVARSPQGTFLFNGTDTLGVYDFGKGDPPERRFAVNLFDATESNIAPRGELQIGHEQVAGTPQVNRAKKEAWRWLMLAALAVLLLEWYIYNRRVYV